MLVWVWRLVLAAFFTAAGANHFRKPALYEAIVPPPLPASACTMLSGLLLMLGGLGLLIRPETASRLLIFTLLAIFPANLYMAWSGAKFGNFPAQPWQAWARLPVQFALMWLVWRAR